LPPTLGYDPERLARFFELLPRTTTEASRLAEQHDARLSGDRVWTVTDAERRLRHVLEVRHRTLGAPEAVELLRAHDVGFVVADTAGRWPVVEQVTSDLMYVRLHGDTELYTSGYDDGALDRWADKCRRWRDDGLDVFVYFDNDVKGYAPWDALRLLDRLRDGTRPHTKDGSAGSGSGPNAASRASS
jgi:uncharacterized protein YecE (DUF72 family)